jgi:conjugative relaxase-like TrwC/TraI family protein
MQPRAIQPHSLFASQQFATAVYQSELTYRVRQLGYEITTGRSGAPEIKGYTQEYLDASSPRSQQIREYLERTGRSGKEAAEIAAHSIPPPRRRRLDFVPPRSAEERTRRNNSPTACRKT